MPSSMSCAASVHPKNSNIIAPESITELGLITSLSAYLGAVRGFKHSVAIANVRARRHPQAANLCGAGVGQIVSVQIGSRQDAVLIRAEQHLLEHGVRDAIIDH